MVPNPTPTTVFMLFFGVLVFLLIMLLPALLELKRPSDAGPRVITENASAILPPIRKKILIVDVEEEQRFDQALVTKISQILAFLPNLEI
jgi:hypothetical protein